jgi:hypothetical protein
MRNKSLCSLPVHDATPEPVEEPMASFFLP